LAAQHHLDDGCDELAEEGGARLADDQGTENAWYQPHPDHDPFRGRDGGECRGRGRVELAPGPEHDAERDGDDGCHDDVDRPPRAPLAACLIADAALVRIDLHHDCSLPVG
jgi:hypothetical protein